ncbi:MAG: hypothetical protein WC881_06980 [Elusimicrobiota bacterium]
MIRIAALAFILSGLAGVGSAAGPEERISALEARLSRLEAAPAKASLSQFNPALGLALDALGRVQDSKSQFQLRAAELSIEAPIDPFLKGYAVIVGSNGDPAFSLEEAALQTTRLPCNLTVRGGRLFATFGRLGYFHDHELPVIDRPESLDSFIGGETRGDGLEVSYLLPTDQYINVVFGMYNKMGGDNDRTSDTDLRPLDQFTFVGRLGTSFDLGDAHGLELGASSAWTPKRTVTEDATVTGNASARSTLKNTWRTLHGVDLTYRYHPPQGGMYRGLVWGAEVLQNDERRFDAATRLPTDRVRAWAGYSFLEFKAGKNWRPGVLADLAEDLDQARRLTRTYAGFVTYEFSEFNRLRLQYSRVTDNMPGRPGSHRVALQWTAILGYHVHGFRGR